MARYDAISNPWDSGQVGFIYVSRQTITEQYGWKRLTQERREQIETILRNEVSTYADYLLGHVYGYTITKERECIESVWGFIGQYDQLHATEHCLNEARQFVDQKLESAVNIC